MWIDHDGGSVPVHAALQDQVLVRFRDGQETTKSEPVRWWIGAASNWQWNRRFPSDSEIIAYKVVR